MRQRLQKILAQAGHGSRRASEQLITSGRVSVNGETVTELGTQADPETDVIEVDGEPVRIPTSFVYLAMNKPWGFLTTARDPRGRRTVVELLPPDLPPNVLPVGRLDRDTEGVLLFTSDGELAHRLAHPRFTIDKEYYALVRGAPDVGALEALRIGVEIDGRRTSPAEAEVTAPPYGYNVRKGHTWLRIVIHEGRKRQVRRMCAEVGHPVRNLVRTRIGDVLLGRLAKGKTRPLTRRELESLRGSVGLG
jgi:23S rRNA pseudouridine2605 synthase